MNVPIINVEKVFANFLELHGAEISDKTLAGPNKPTNADYIFHNEKVIAELKLLKRDPFDNKDFSRSFVNRRNKWIEDGFITEDELQGVERISQLPDYCYEDIVKLYMNPVKQHIKSANDQIKKTKDRRSLNDYKGLLFIGSEGNYFLQPKHVWNFVARILKPSNVYSSINTVVYLTVNVTTTRPNDLFHSRLWINLYRGQDQFKNVSIPFLNELYSAWILYYQKVTKVEITNISEIDESGYSELDLLDDTIFVRPQ